MKARYQYRVYPTAQQRQSLSQLFGCVRVVWNDALALCKASEKLPGYNKLSALLTQSKKSEERQWLSDVSSVPLQQILRQLDTAYKNFFNSRNGKRKGGKMGLPKFKKKSNKQTATFADTAFKVSDNTVYLAKIGDLKPVWSRELPAYPSSVTVIKDAANRYFLSFVVEEVGEDVVARFPRHPVVRAREPRHFIFREIEPLQMDAKNQSIGIDLGIKTFAMMSDGSKAESPSYSKQDRRIRKLQKHLARQQKGSKRRERTRIRIGSQHNQIADKRKDFLHKLSTKVVNENQVIVLEDLNVSGMVRNRKLARAISLQGWRDFRVLCEGKSEKLGRTFQTVSRWEPTSQVCSHCGFKWGKLDLSIRSVLCISCGTEHDRDANAARNIEAVALREVPSRKHLQQEMVGMGHRHDLK